MKLFLTPVWILLKKEFRIEFRSRVAINGLLLFVLVSVALVNFSVGYMKLQVPVFFGLIWLCLFFSSMYGLSRTFVAESDQGTSDFLRQLARPSQIFLSKLLFNLVLSLLIGFVLFLSFFFFFEAPDIHWGFFIAGLFLGTLAIASTTTLLASIVAQADSKGALFPVLSFPLMIPLIMTLVTWTKNCVSDDTIPALWEPFSVLIAFIGVTTTASILLFDFIWD
ncbi:MAG: heme exporter protein CcmB [Bacteroidetes bacterium]|nr:heme exporter protein CcmB [Bacteroidota bacterium]